MFRTGASGGVVLRPSIEQLAESGKAICFASPAIEVVKQTDTAQTARNIVAAIEAA